MDVGQTKKTPGSAVSVRILIFVEITSSYFVVLKRKRKRTP